MPERPLITYGVLTFNQERFVREAVSNAFAQTYSPLEIILSDDRSTDGTWGIIQEMAAAYKGPHRVRLNQNAKNIGLGAHVNVALNLAGGELFVAAAGDDISEARRTECIYQAWEQSGRRATAVTSHVKIVDEGGRELSDVRTHISDKNPGLLHRARYGCWNIRGCSEAWHRRVFETFGPLQPYVVAEDRAMEFRCWALGPVVAVDDYLVHYRVHGANLSGLADSASRVERELAFAKNLRVQHAMYRQFLVDLDRIEDLKLSPAWDIQRARRLIVRNLRNNLLHQEVLRGSSDWRSRISLLALLASSPKTAVKHLIWRFRS